MFNRIYFIPLPLSVRMKFGSDLISRNVIGIIKENSKAWIVLSLLRMMTNIRARARASSVFIMEIRILAGFG